MTSIVGANIGAKEIIRAEKVGIYGGSTAGIVSVFIGLTLALFPESWIQFFTNDHQKFLDLFSHNSKDKISKCYISFLENL